MNIFNNVSNTLLTKSLDGIWKRGEIISQNIANQQTPEYKRKYVTFEEALNAQIQDQGKKKSQMVADIDNINPTVNIADNETLRLDGNNVDIVYENAQLASNQIQQATTVRLLSDYYSRLRYVINDGKK